eukprot:TRINITY_DN274_c1_g2_i1.p1 TRINITY_DN274_c1_g2~~TRINITY_DN274_c1_g2_i1.p1  ORF type:complete len:397 (-),score=63.32 TRINITY_DN274_c1_g2_i1:326-1357(-)
MAPILGSYSAGGHIDCAVTRPSNSDSGDDDDNTKFTVALSVSNLNGNEWGGEVHLIDIDVAGDKVHRAKQPLVYAHGGFASISWAGDDNQLVCGASDDGNLVVFNLAGKDSEDGDNDSNVEVISGHDDIASSVSTNVANRSLAATGSWDKTVKLWNLQTLQQTSTYRGHIGVVNEVDWSRQKNLLASVSEDATAKVWDQRQEGHTHSISVGTSPLYSVAWNPNVDWIVALSDEVEDVHIVDIRSAQVPICTLRNHTGIVKTLAWSLSHEDVLAMGSDDTTASVVRVPLAANGDGPTTLQTFGSSEESTSTHKHFVRAVAWNASSSRLLTGAWDRSAHLHQVNL